MPLAENGLDVAPQNVKDNDISEKVPRTAKQEWCRQELPRVSIVNSRITDCEKIADEPGLKRIQENLDDERSNVDRG